MKIYPHILCKHPHIYVDTVRFRLLSYLTYMIIKNIFLDFLEKFVCVGKNLVKKL